MSTLNYIPDSDLEELYLNCKNESLDFEGATVLLAGSGGFLGSYFKGYFLYLNQHVLKNPVKVICCDCFIGRNKPVSVEDPNIINLDHDITIPLGFKLAKYKITHVINASGCASPSVYSTYPIETMRVSTVGTDNLLELAMHNKAKILNFSSSEVLQVPDEVPTTENQIPKIHTMNKRSCYDTTKAYIETASWVWRTYYGVDAKVVRPFNAIGRMRQDDYRVFSIFADAILKKKNLKVYSPGTQTRTFVWVSDLISGCIKVLTRGKEPLYHIGNPEGQISMIDLAYLFEKVCGTTGLTQLIPTNDVYKHEPLVRCPSIELARKELNYNPTVQLEEMIRRFHAYAIKNYIY